MNSNPITITLKVNNIYDLMEVKALYESFAELPDIFKNPRYLQSERTYPCELYLIFSNKRKYNRFLKKLLVDLPKVKIVASY